MNRKTRLEKLAFASRYEIAAVLEDGAEFAKPNEETISVEEIAEFLRLSGIGHKSYSKYTRASRLAGLLKTRRLYLSRLTEMNDLDELMHTPDASRIYVASFCFGSLESMGMWKQYGGDESEAVRLDFDGVAVRRLCAKQVPVFEVPVANDKPTGDTGVEIPAEEVEFWSLHDVAYKYGEALRWNGLTVGIGRCRSLKNVWDNKELSTFVKRFGWAGENEVRLVIKLRKTVPERKWIAVDFGAAIDSMAVVLGPCYSKAAKVIRAFAEQGLPCDKIVQSSYCAEI